MMPRGRFPSGIVAMTARVPTSITLRSPDVSLVTSSRGPSGAGKAGVAAEGRGAGALEQAARVTHHARHISLMRMIGDDIML
jgi:hypothetical protein